MSQTHFLIPHPTAFPSGGNAYNLHLMEALGRLGMHVSHSAFQPHVLYASPDTHYVLDSIYFPQITESAIQIPVHCIGLVHHLGSLFPLSSEVFERQESPILTAFDALLVTSDFTRDYLVGHQIEASRIHVIEPAPLMPPSSREPGDKVRALMLGSCEPRKGQLEFLQGLAASPLDPYFTLTIAGSLTTDPVYARACTDLVLGSAVLSKCVHFTGAQDPEVIPRLYAKANLFVSASAMETFGMAIQDAVVSGLPVIAREGGYAAEHVSEHQNGYRCQSIQGLVQIFIQCVTDRTTFLALQARAAAHPHHYNTWDHAAQQFSDAFLTNPHP